VPVLGVVENMSYLENPETGKPIAVFGSGGGQALADEVNVPLLAQIPLDPRVVEGGDTGARSRSPSPRQRVARARPARRPRARAHRRALPGGGGGALTPA
jgi:ATP-binding protein involved in chromosome partitioning